MAGVKQPLATTIAANEAACLALSSPIPKLSKLGSPDTSCQIPTICGHGGLNAGEHGDCYAILLRS